LGLLINIHTTKTQKEHKTHKADRKEPFVLQLRLHETNWNQPQRNEEQEEQSEKPSRSSFLRG
jgi:hypothetical protein